MAKRKEFLSPFERGRRDGFDGIDARESHPDYLAGYARGRADRQAAHERLEEACERERRMVTRWSAATLRRPGAKVVTLADLPQSPPDAA